MTRAGTGNGVAKRRLPERSLPVAPPEQVHAYPPPGVRLFRSNLPRPAPVVHQFAQSRVPLPPVPELDRSDHERESMSPVPEQRNLRPSPPKPKSLPSPLVTPIQPSERHHAKPRRAVPRSSADLTTPNSNVTQNFYQSNNNVPRLHQVRNRRRQNRLYIVISKLDLHLIEIKTFSCGTS